MILTPGGAGWGSRNAESLVSRVRGWGMGKIEGSGLDGKSQGARMAVEWGFAGPGKPGIGWLVEGWVRVRTTEASQELPGPGPAPAPKALCLFQQLPQPPLPWAGSCAAPSAFSACQRCSHSWASKCTSVDIRAPAGQGLPRTWHPLPGPTPASAEPTLRPTSQPVWARLAPCPWLTGTDQQWRLGTLRSEQHRAEDCGGGRRRG